MHELYVNFHVSAFRNREKGESDPVECGGTQKLYNKKNETLNILCIEPDREAADSTTGPD